MMNINEMFEMGIEEINAHFEMQRQADAAMYEALLKEQEESYKRLRNEALKKLSPEARDIWLRSEKENGLG